MSKPDLSMLKTTESGHIGNVVTRYVVLICCSTTAASWEEGVQLQRGAFRIQTCVSQTIKISIEFDHTPKRFL
jgi:hypothetical protein